MVSEEKMYESEDGLFQGKTRNEQSWRCCEIGQGHHGQHLYKLYMA